MEKRDVEKNIKKIVQPIFNRVLKERSSNSMTTIKNTFSIFWRPNNYRRKIIVKTKTNSTIKEIKGTIPNLPVESKFNYNNHTKLISIKKYRPNITIQYGRETLTVIYSQNIIRGHKEVFFIESYSIDGLQEWIKQKKEEIEKNIDIALSDFIKDFKIGLPLKKPSWGRYEDFIKGEEYIDKIPREVIIHDTYFKKVYGKGIEFKNTGYGEEPTIHLKNYIKNRAIENIAPEIADSINKIGGYLYNSIDDFKNTIIGDLNPSLKQLNKNILLEIENKQLHQKVLNDMSSTLRGISSNISKKSLKHPKTTKYPTSERKYGLSDANTKKIKNMRI